MADDAIGLVIIAVFYPDPHHPVEPVWLLATVSGMTVAFMLLKLRVRWWPVYILTGGSLSWVGLAAAGVEPALALALAPVVPFLPHAAHNGGTEPERVHTGKSKSDPHPRAMAPKQEGHNALELFERHVKVFVDFGLFFFAFAFANASVVLSNIGVMTFMVLLSLLAGKGIGIALFSWLASRVGFPLPPGMELRHLVVAAVIAGTGLTVALFVAGEAFPDASPFQEPARKGAALSIVAALVGFVLSKVLRMDRRSSRCGHNSRGIA